MLLMKMMVWPLGSNVCALKLRHPGLPSPPRPSVLFGTSLLYQITVTWKPNNIQASLSVWCNYITTITHRTHMKSPSICGGLVKDAGKERSFLRWKTPWKTSQSLPYLQPRGALTGLRWNWRCCRCDAPTPTQTQSCCVSGVTRVTLWNNEPLDGALLQQNKLTGTAWFKNRGIYCVRFTEMRSVLLMHHIQEEWNK